MRNSTGSVTFKAVDLRTKCSPNVFYEDLLPITLPHHHHNATTQLLTAFINNFLAIRWMPIKANRKGVLFFVWNRY